MADDADREQREEGDGEQDDGRRRGAGRVAALDASEDEDGRDLGVERDVPGDDHEGPELADGLRERERDAGEDAGEDVGEDDAAERRRPGGAERMRRLLELGIELQTGCTVRTTNGSVTNIIARTIDVRVKATSMPTGEVGP